MNEDVKTRAKALLEDGRVDGVLGLSLVDGEPCPALFIDPQQTDTLVTEPKWLLAKTAMGMLKTLPDSYRLGIVCRGCDERALTELAKRNQLDLQRIRLIGLVCSPEQARACMCTMPYTSLTDPGERHPGTDPRLDERAKPFLEGSLEDRLEKWTSEFSKCIKCYGCRNACPICVCVPCKLEDDLWVKRGEIPADRVSYHLIRAFHLSDSCVGCGGCMDACPVHIPLMLLQVSMREALKEAYGYETGLDPARVSPVLADLVQEPSPRYEEPGCTDSLQGES